MGKIANITIVKNKIKIEIDLKSSATPNSEFLTQDFDVNNSLESERGPIIITLELTPAS